MARKVKRTSEATAAELSRIEKRDRIVRSVEGYMRTHHRTMTIDTLLSRPVDSLAMGVHVAMECNLMNDFDCKRIKRLIKDVVHHSSAALDAIDRICHTAINARKSGKLKQIKKP